jgi:hypothetical protein
VSDQQVPEPADFPRTDEPRLTVPAPARLPVTLRHDGPGAVARLAARGLIPGASRAASVVGVAAAAAVTGAAVAVRLLRPLIMEARAGLRPPNRLPITAQPFRAVVHIRYTRWEVHWPDQPD